MMAALVVSNTQVMHASLAAKVIPSDPTVRSGLAAMFNPSTTTGAMALNSEITRQASMVAYVNDFRLMFYITLACIPMLLIMRAPKRQAGGEPVHAAVD